MEDLIFLFFILMVVGIGILAVILKVAFVIWLVRRGSRSLQNYQQAAFQAYQQAAAYNQAVFQAYNQAIEEQFRQLAWAIQQGWGTGEILRETQMQIAKLPRRERKTHQARLSDIVSERATLNERTGEWEEGTGRGQARRSHR